jgi:hypothetical protein
LPLPGFKHMDDPKSMNMSLSHKAIKKQLAGE